MSTLHKKLHEIDIKTERLESNREKICEQIHKDAIEAEQRKALEYKTIIQNGDYGFYNNAPVIFVNHRGEIVMNGLDGTQPMINMNNKEKESFFIKHGNVFEELKRG